VILVLMSPLGLGLGVLVLFPIVVIEFPPCKCASVQGGTREISQRAVVAKTKNLTCLKCAGQISVWVPVWSFEIILSLPETEGPQALMYMLDRRVCILCELIFYICIHPTTRIG
jgi:hypothetical protein